MAPQLNFSFFSVTKAGHALHTDFLRHLSGKITVDQEQLAGRCSDVHGSCSSYVR